MGVTAHPQAAVYVSVVARICRVQVDYAFLQQYQSLRRLECRTRRIGAHQRTVKQRPRFVVYEFAVILAALSAHKQTRVIGGRRHKAQYFAGRRLDGHDSSALAHHQRFGILLKFDVETQAKIAAAQRSYVVRTVLVTPLNAAVGGSYEYFHSFVAAQVGFVAFLHSEVAGIVARGVIIVALDVFCIHLADVAEHIRRRGMVVLAQYTLLYEKARKAVKLLLQSSVILARQLGYKALRRVG